MLSLRIALLEGKTQNSEVLMLRLRSRSFGGVKKGTREGGRKEGGGREGGEREGETTNSTSCGFSTGPSSI